MQTPAFSRGKCAEDHLRVRSRIKFLLVEMKVCPYLLPYIEKQLTDFFLFLCYISFGTDLRFPCLVKYFTIYLMYSMVNDVGLG